MSKPTEWDINGGDFNKPVDFEETIKPGEPLINWSMATDPDLQISEETLRRMNEEQTIEPKIIQVDEDLTPEQIQEWKNVMDIPRNRGKQKSKRINPDSIRVLAFAVILVSILMLSSFTVSFSGIYEVSAWTGIPQIIQWLPALFIDAAILAYTISLVVFKARGESTWRTLLGLSGFAAMSVVANIAHTLSFWNGTLSDYRAWIGVAITAAAPIAVLLASEEITRLAFAQPEDK